MMPHSHRLENPRKQCETSPVQCVLSYRLSWVVFSPFIMFPYNSATHTLLLISRSTPPFTPYPILLVCPTIVLRLFSSISCSLPNSDFLNCWCTAWSWTNGSKLPINWPSPNSKNEILLSCYFYRLNVTLMASCLSIYLFRNQKSNSKKIPFLSVYQRTGSGCTKSVPRSARRALVGKIWTKLGGNLIAPLLLAGHVVHGVEKLALEHL
jgi:hypothetical protein